MSQRLTYRKLKPSPYQYTTTGSNNKLKFSSQNSASHISLPSIKSKVYINQRPAVDGDAVDKQNLPLEMQEEDNQVRQLNQWSCLNENTRAKRKGSNIMNKLYMNKEFIHRRSFHRLTESAITMDAKLFFMRLESELKKANDINYNSIYKNIEYCSGVYEKLYGSLLRTVDNLGQQLNNRLEVINERVRIERLDHIQHMEKENMEEYKYKIPKIRQDIQQKEGEIQTLRTTIDTIHNARLTILKHCLFHGYDVRQNGIIWILRELKEQPKTYEFPSFLNDKQISYILSIFRKQKKKQETLQNEQKILQSYNKTNDQIYEIVTRRQKGRQLSMIKEESVMRSLRQAQADKLVPIKHQYIHSDILQLAENALYHTKATKYEIIYKEAQRKLKKICLNQIYKKNKKNKDTNQLKRNSLTTNKVLSYFTAKLQDYMHGQHHSQIQNDQQKQLDEILKGLRYESYQEKGGLSVRNPVSIICCLVGWRKAKRMIQTEMNYIL